MLLKTKNNVHKLKICCIGTTWQMTMFVMLIILLYGWNGLNKKGVKLYSLYTACFR